MTLDSSVFFLFLFISLVFYYFFGRWAAKYILLATSLFFYIAVSQESVIKTAIVLLFVVLITYIGGLSIERTNRKKAVCFLFVGCLIVVLAYIKYVYNISSSLVKVFRLDLDVSMLKVYSYMGISYFTLSAIGYLLDVSWGVYKAERNIVSIALFVLFFPQVISGPVTKYSFMRERLCSYHKLSYENLYNGVRRMLWGYFKKYVISERFAIIVQTAYNESANSSGAVLFIGTVAYAIRLYTDFSGCMDIVIGTAQLFGVELPENFRAPFYSKTIQEFWQRWHITLGVWFKEYLMYPIQKSDVFLKIGKNARKIFGKNVGKKIPFYMALAVLWTLMGIWHGGIPYYFVASGVAPFILLTISDLASAPLASFVKLLGIKKQCYSYRIFESLRTVLIICIIYIFVCSESVMKGINNIRTIVCGDWSIRNALTCIVDTGLTIQDAVLLEIALLLLFIDDFYINRGGKTLKWLDSQNYLFRVVTVTCILVMILWFGKFGESQFIYFQF